MVHFDFGRLFDLTGSIFVAFLLATAIGAERQYRQRSAGLRTNVLVAIGAAAFVSVGSRLGGTSGASQLASYVVSGIGFLGAGVIMKEGRKVWGLNTAATLWCSAAVGLLCGIGLMAEALMVTLSVLAANTLLRPLVNAINRSPIDEKAAEATYEVHVMTRPEHVGAVRDRLSEALEQAHYPVSDIDVIERSDDVVELSATLVSTAVDPDELDAVTALLSGSSIVSHATWSSSSED